MLTLFFDGGRCTSILCSSLRSTLVSFALVPIWFSSKEKKVPLLTDFVTFGTRIVFGTRITFGTRIILGPASDVTPSRHHLQYFSVVGGWSVPVSAPMLLSLSMLLLSPGYAFVGKVSSVRASRSLGMLAQQTSGKPLTELCEISKQACEAVAPMLQGDVWCCILVDNVYSIL